MHAIISFFSSSGESSNACDYIIFSESLDLKSVTSPLLFKLVSSNVASENLVEKLAEKI